MLKKSLLGILLIVFALGSSFCQDCDTLLHKAQCQKYIKMKKGGTGLIVAGTLTLGLGTVCMMSAEWTKEGTEYTSTDAAAAVGMLLVMGSIPMITVGIVKTSRGSYKIKKLNEECPGLKIGFNGNYKAPGLTLAYHF